MNKGFTLIEVIISIAILSIIALGMLSVLNTSHVKTIMTGNRNVDMYLAESDIEHLLSGGSVTTSTETNSTVTVTFGSHSFNVSGRNILVQVPTVDLNGKTTADLFIFLPD